jgi:hypothetical protein
MHSNMRRTIHAITVIIKYVFSDYLNGRSRRLANVIVFRLKRQPFNQVTDDPVKSMDSKLSSEYERKNLSRIQIDAPARYQDAEQMHCGLQT